MNNVLKFNPEFAKNLWLEFSLQRLIAMPAILALLCILVFATNDDPVQKLHGFSLIAFVIITVLWGMKNAGDSVIEEYNEKTWDWQKMSIVGPWKLAWGKLFGGTSYNWYGGLICLAVFFATLGGSPTPAADISTAFVYILGAIISQGIMILFALQVIKKADGKTKIRNGLIFLAIIVWFSISSGIYTGVTSIFTLSSFVTEGFAITWFGIDMSYHVWMVFFASFYCFWVVFGLYRSMRAELQYTDKPWAWLSFLVANFVFLLGHVLSLISKYASTDLPLTATGGLAITCGIICFYYIMLAYFVALSEPKDIINFRVLTGAWKSGNYKKFWENISLWIITIPVAFIFGVLAILFAITAGNQMTDIYLKYSITGGGSLLLVLTAVFAFVARDMGIMLLLNFSKVSKRADSAWVVYLVLLYTVIAYLGKQAKVGVLFYPDFFNTNFYVAALLPVIEAAVVIGFLVYRWRSLSSEAVEVASRDAAY